LRKASIREAMVFGMLLCYRGLPMDEVVRWMNEIGGVIVDDYRVRRRSVAKKELEKLPVLYGILLGCSRSIAVGGGFVGDDQREVVFALPYRPVRCNYSAQLLILHQNFLPNY